MNVNIIISENSSSTSVFRLNLKEGRGSSYAKTLLDETTGTRVRKLNRLFTSFWLRTTGSVLCFF